jgi:hypothetical protein
MTDNAPEIRRMNVRAVRASIDFFKYLTVRGGRLIRNGNRYTLEVSGGAAGRWSGYWKFGGAFYGGPEMLEDIQGRYFGVEIASGDESWSDDPTDFDNIEWFYVANKNEETGEYSLSNRTCGDIIVRVT